jgi:UDP-glucose 4-epimerase
MLGTVVVTGAGGFVGQETCATLLRAGYAVHALVRRPSALPEPRAARLTVSVVEDLVAYGRLEELLTGADALIHLAARVHRVAEQADVAVSAYRRDVEMTRALALAAQRVGVRRVVFLSSIKALGDRSPDGAFTRRALPNPVDPYGRAKLAAERELEGIHTATRLEVAVVRAPLVYGAAASANFRELVRWVRRGVPLPFAAVRNRRSIVSIDNLSSFIVRCLGPLDAPFTTLHVSDPAPVSTPQLLRSVAAGLNQSARLFSVPTPVLESLCGALGRADLAARLLMSLEFDTEDSFAALGWRPATDSREGIMCAVRGMSL